MPTGNEPTFLVSLRRIMKDIESNWDKDGFPSWEDGGLIELHVLDALSKLKDTVANEVAVAKRTEQTP